MKIAVGSDHRGHAVQQRIAGLLRTAGHEVVERSNSGEESSDYPDVAAEVAAAVSQGQVDRGILICGTGIGMSIAANKLPGVRAAVCHDDITAEMSRRHNDTNVLCLSADLLGARLIERMVEIWTNTEFEGGRHARRVEKIRELESRFGRPATPPPGTGD